MKVYTSLYREHWISPYTMIEKAVFWRRVAILEEDWVIPVVKFLTPISKGIQWVLDRVHPRVNYIKIDHWDTWSMYTTLSPIILPMLKQLKASKHGYPSDLTEKKWEKMLDKMIWSFEMVCKDDVFFHGFDFGGKYSAAQFRKYNKHMEKVQEGLKLFGERYLDLWD